MSPPAVVEKGVVQTRYFPLLKFGVSWITGLVSWVFSSDVNGQDMGYPDGYPDIHILSI
jgi:hypothetical protein